MLPCRLDSGLHAVGQDDELGWPVVIKGAKADDVYLGHSGRDIARKRGERKGGNSKL